MSEFKFACPVCGQHISCDTTKAGSQMQCPTCFQKLTVPQASEDDSSKFVLTASMVQTRPIPHLVVPKQPLVKKQFPVAAIALVVALCALVVLGFVFRDKLFNRVKQSDISSAAAQSPQPAQNAPPPTTPATANGKWMLNLDSVAIPDSPVTGTVHGKTLSPERVILDGGTLTLRTANPGPPEAGVSIYLHASRGEELAGQSVNIKSDSGNAPWVNLRWKDGQGQPVTDTVKNGYALRIEFSHLAGNHLPGKIYLCTPDDSKSWLAGRFDAEILPPKQ